MPVPFAVKPLAIAAPAGRGALSRTPWKLALGLAALAMAGSAWAVPHSCKKIGKDIALPAAGQVVDYATGVLEDKPAVDPDMLPYTTYHYGSVIWREPSEHCFIVGQTFDFFVGAGNPKTIKPTIVYFHGNGSSSHMTSTSISYKNVVLPAVKLGFNVASVEYRHPVTDQYLAQYEGGVVPQYDTGLAVQYLRGNAPTYHIDPDNIFSFGHSRGTLALWQMLQPDMGGGDTGLPSSLPTGYFGFQPNTTYQCQQFSDLFLVQDQDAADEVAQCETENPYWQQFGSAIDSVNAGSLHVHLQSDQGFVLVKGTSDQVKLLKYPRLIADGFNTGHYPDYAIALLDRYEAFGNPNMDYPEENIPDKQCFAGWQQWVEPLIQGTGARRP